MNILFSYIILYCFIDTPIYQMYMFFIIITLNAAGLNFNLKVSIYNFILLGNQMTI